MTTVVTRVLMANPVLSSGLRNIDSLTSGDAAVCSTSTNTIKPITATSSSAVLSGPKLPRPKVIASA
ncbi:hypothetical protein D3C81_1244290 [compost metagenome]